MGNVLQVVGTAVCNHNYYRHEHLLHWLRLKQQFLITLALKHKILQILLLVFDSTFTPGLKYVGLLYPRDGAILLCLANLSKQVMGLFPQSPILRGGEDPLNKKVSLKWRGCVGRNVCEWVIFMFLFDVIYLFVHFLFVCVYAK